MCISLYYGYYLRSLGFGASLRSDGFMLSASRSAVISEVSVSETRGKLGIGHLNL